MSELKKRLYEMEVDPPEEVWKRLAASLDEINADNSVAHKIQGLEIDPAYSVWERIKSRIYGPELNTVEKRIKLVVPFRKLAAAAILAGLVITAYFLFFNKQNAGINFAKTDTPKKSEKIIQPEGREASTDNSGNRDENPATTPQIAIRKTSGGGKNAGFRIASLLPASKRKAPAEPIQFTSTGVEKEKSEEIKEKIFKEQIDDLSLMASNERYISMFSADGRMVKIPARFSSLAPYLQDKSSANDYLDILFEESTYWKEKFREWRQKLAQSSVTPSVDNFFDIIGLLKSIQDN